jgi:hypothetical protein
MPRCVKIANGADSSPRENELANIQLLIFKVDMRFIALVAVMMPTFCVTANLTTST